MPEVGVRELKARASEIVREVRERGTRYVVTYRGRPVGVLMPIAGAPERQCEGQDAWQELFRLGAELAKEWRSPLTSLEILDEMRR